MYPLFINFSVKSKYVHLQPPWPTRGFFPRFQLGLA